MAFELPKIFERLHLIRGFFFLTFAVLIMFPGAAPAGAQDNQPPVSSSMPPIALNPSGDGVTVVRARESFSSLSLAGSELDPEKPLVGDRQETPEFVREVVRLQWRPGDAVDLFVILPKGVSSPPVVLYLYGFPSDTNRFRDDAYCKRLVHTGVAAVGFVSAFTGPRNEHHALNQSFITELPEALATTVHDVQLILNYLETRHDLDTSRVGMFGEGSGGTIAILAAEADARIKAIDLLSPWADWSDWLARSSDVPEEKRKYLLQSDLLERLQPLEPLRYLPDLKSRQVRMLFKGDDTTVPAEVVSKIEFSAPAGAKIVLYPTTKEFIAAITGGRLFEWIAGELKPAAAQQAGLSH